MAIANEGGGYLVLGVSDKRPRPVVGTAAFANPVETAANLFQSLGFRVDIEPVDHPDGRVLVFHIPSRPRGTAYHFEGAYLMRSGEALVPMSEDHLRRIFSEGGPDWLEDHCIHGIDGQRVIDLLDTQAFFDLLHLPYPSARQAVLDRLVQERLVDVLANHYAIRRIGALIVARRLDDFADLARKAPRLVVYPGTSKLETRLDQPGEKGYAAGFQDLLDMVIRQLPQGEFIDGALRHEKRLVPQIAVRETLANALIHQDFNIGGTGVMIEIYADRVEITNPGDPVVPVERFIDGYQSRNERLADLMRRMGICEEKSSGIDKVIHAAEQNHLPAPDFKVGHRRTIAVLFGHRDFDQMDRGQRVRACYQHCALKYVMAAYMTNQSLRERFRLPESKSAVVSQVIAQAVEAGVIKADETVGASRKHARYLPFWA